MSNTRRNPFYFQEYYQRNKERILLQRQHRYHENHGTGVTVLPKELTTDIPVRIEGDTILIPLDKLCEALIFNRRPRFIGLPEYAENDNEYIDREIRSGKWSIL